MNLTVDSDAAYLVLPGAKSRYAGYFQLLNSKATPGMTDNGAIHVDVKLYAMLSLVQQKQKLMEHLKTH